jgi:hypothetical protein
MISNGSKEAGSSGVFGSTSKFAEKESEDTVIGILSYILDTGIA